jgi:hypothetical protein
MFLDIVFVEMLAHDGTRNSFYIKPKSEHERVIIDRYREIPPDSPCDKIDIGGNRIYNFDKCTMEHLKTVLHLKVHDDVFSFKIKHERIPVGSIDEGHIGLYNLILAPGLRFTDLRIIDPFDSKHKDKDKKEIEYQVFWDKKYEVQLVEMKLRSRRGSFSFILNGSFIHINSPGEHNFVNCFECDGRLVSLTDHYNLLNDNEKKALSDWIIEKLNRYLKIEPEIFRGVSVKGNKILEDYQEKHSKEKIINKK